MVPVGDFSKTSPFAERASGRGAINLAPVHYCVTGGSNFPTFEFSSLYHMSIRIYSNVGSYLNCFLMDSASLWVILKCIAWQIDFIRYIHSDTRTFESFTATHVSRTRRHSPKPFLSQKWICPKIRAAPWPSFSWNSLPVPVASVSVTLRSIVAWIFPRRCTHIELCRLQSNHNFSYLSIF